MRTLLAALLSLSWPLPVAAAPCDVVSCSESVCEIDCRPVADTYVEAGTEATWDHGASDHVDVDLAPFGITYLKFDLSGVSGRVTRATLRLYCTNSSGDGGTIYPVADSSWVEGDRTGLSSRSANGPGLKWVDVDCVRDDEVDARDGSCSSYVPLFARPVVKLGAVSEGRRARTDVTAAFQDGAKLYTAAISSRSKNGATYSSRQHPRRSQRPRLRLVVDTTPLSGPPDLDVTYIGRTPRYPRYALDYTLAPGDPWRIPRLCAGTENDKRWPAPGERVTYTAHVRNKGTFASPAYSFEWRSSGNRVGEGSATPLAPGAEATFDYVALWPASPEIIEFRVDPGDTIVETAEGNNALAIGSHDLSLSIWVEEGLYDIFNRTENLSGSRSFEDWIQAQFAKMNERFGQARYPVAPDGIRDRVRIDKMVVLAQGDGVFSGAITACSPDDIDPDKLLIDGRWIFTDGDPTDARGAGGEWQAYVDGFVNTIDFGLIHELAHQLGVIDLYRMNLANEPSTNNRFQVLDLAGQVIPASRLPTFGFDQLLFQFPGIMVGGDTSPYRDGTYFESHTAGGLNSHYNRRRGYFGEYLFDTPAATHLKVLDGGGLPLAGVEVQLYQKGALDEVFDDTPEIVGATGPDGRMPLPNRPVAVPITTATGHTLRANPFGQIFHEGTNGTMLVRAVDRGQELYGWLFIIDLNLAYWEGRTDEAEIPVVVVPPRI